MKLYFVCTTYAMPDGQYAWRIVAAMCPSRALALTPWSPVEANANELSAANVPLAGKVLWEHNCKPQ